MDNQINHQVVSSESEALILVNDQDEVIGHETKAKCHDGDGILHRAFSIFIFNDNGELLLQQRSEQKRLWPLFWSNSVCSHPRKGETMDVAVQRRLDQELGLACELEFIYKFKYQVNFAEIGAEHELCSVYLGKSSDATHTNANEIAATRYIEPADLEQELEQHPENFTPWFKMEWDRLNHEFKPQIARYIV